MKDFIISYINLIDLVFCAKKRCEFRQRNRGFIVISSGSFRNRAKFGFGGGFRDGLPAQSGALGGAFWLRLNVSRIYGIGGGAQ